jgi:hypothetical protein
MSKYDGLGNYLLRQNTELVPMRFSEIEHVTGTKLPPKAQHHRAWWSNNPSNNVLTKVWLAAGFRTEQVDMVARRLVFRRSGKAVASAMREDTQPFQGQFSAVHPLIGALKGTFTITGWNPEEPGMGRDEAAQMDAGIDKTADLIEQGLQTSR